MTSKKLSQRLITNEWIHCWLQLDQQEWGLFDSSSETVYLHQEKETGDEDLLDFAAAHTLLNGGTVYAVPPEKIPYSTPVAAIFRY